MNACLVAFRRICDVCLTALGPGINTAIPNCKDAYFRAIGKLGEEKFSFSGFPVSVQFDRYCPDPYPTQAAATSDPLICAAGSSFQNAQ